MIFFFILSIWFVSYVYWIHVTIVPVMVGDNRPYTGTWSDCDIGTFCKTCTYFIKPLQYIVSVVDTYTILIQQIVYFSVKCFWFIGNIATIVKTVPGLIRHWLDLHCFLALFLCTVKALPNVNNGSYIISLHIYFGHFVLLHIYTFTLILFVTWSLLLLKVPFPEGTFARDYIIRFL